MDPLLCLTIAAVISVILFDFTNGFHDGANIICKATVKEMDVLGVPPGKHEVIMAIRIREGVAALQQGYVRLEGAPAEVVNDCILARKLERVVERAYRQALAELFQGGDLGSGHPEVHPAAGAGTVWHTGLHEWERIRTRQSTPSHKAVEGGAGRIIVGHGHRAGGDTMGTEVQFRPPARVRVTDSLPLGRQISFFNRKESKGWRSPWTACDLSPLSRGEAC